MPASLVASPFAGTAPYYDRFRAPYAQAAFDFLVEAYDLSEGVRALDLGCGPGTIAIPLSYTVAEVVAVHPTGHCHRLAHAPQAGRLSTAKCTRFGLA